MRTEDGNKVILQQVMIYSLVQRENHRWDLLRSPGLSSLRVTWQWPILVAGP